MKDLESVRQILGMSYCDTGDMKLWVSQEKYIEKVLKQFYMKDAKPVSGPLGGHFKLTKNDLSDNEIEEMKIVSYTSVVGSLMYGMVSTRSDIAYAIGAMSTHLKNSGREH